MNREQFLNRNLSNDEDKTIVLDENVMPKLTRNALQFNKERQSVILQSIGDGVIETDTEGNIILMNPVAEQLTGWKFEDAENKPISDVFRIVDSISREEGDNLVKKVLKTGKSLTLDPGTVLISHNQKKEYSINDSCAPILDLKGNIMGVVLVFRDVTIQKNEDAIKEKITADLVQRNKDHEHFSDIISHDMRSPVANIISLIELLNDNDLKEDEREFIMNALTTSAQRLDDVIIDLNVILSMGRQLNDKKEYLFFSKIVTDIQDSIANILEKEQVNFKIDFSEIDEMFTIKSYMYSIFYNLISNSIKYRRPDVPLVITVKSELLKDKTILSFKDNGLGVDLNKSGIDMFGLYKRFHTDQAEGKGMGLYMVKMQVEKLGGSIRVTSEVNKGTEFKVVFYT